MQCSLRASHSSASSGASNRRNPPGSWHAADGQAGSIGTVPAVAQTIASSDELFARHDPGGGVLLLDFVMPALGTDDFLKTVQAAAGALRRETQCALACGERVPRFTTARHLLESRLH
jgi:hypothetical protein